MVGGRSDQGVAWGFNVFLTYHRLLKVCCDKPCLRVHANKAWAKQADLLAAKAQQCVDGALICRVACYVTTGNSKLPQQICCFLADRTALQLPAEWLSGVGATTRALPSICEWSICECATACCSFPTLPLEDVNQQNETNIYWVYGASVLPVN